MQDLISEIQWLVSDWQFGETPARLREQLWRPFASTEQHDETLIANHNALVGERDVVLCVGDVTYREAPDHLDRVGRLNGRKILVRGNHDRVHADAALASYFEHVVADGDGIEFEHDAIPLYATHYPTRARKDRFNIVGHVHGLWRCQLNMINVSVDSFGFAPLAIDRVKDLKTAIERYYDRDVWAAYEDVNARFRGQRGVDGAYFDEAADGN